jgi:hypothetical protein
MERAAGHVWGWSDRFFFPSSRDSVSGQEVQLVLAPTHFQLAGCGSPGAREETRATPDTTVPNGTYWWRVQAVDANGNTSPWSAPRSIEKLWSDSPTLTSPDEDAVIAFPDEPLVLRWDPVPGAAKYSVEIANDLGLSSLVTSGGNPVVIQATNLAPALLLPSNMYFWAVTPLDAKGQPRPAIRDPLIYLGLAIDDHASRPILLRNGAYDPEPRDPVSGAARYEVEVNSSSDFASGSKVCCTDKPIATTVAARGLVNNRYYWRVRAITRGTTPASGTKASSTRRSTTTRLGAESAIKNLRMRDRPIRRRPEWDPGYQTDSLIVTWDPVPERLLPGSILHDGALPEPCI